MTPICPRGKLRLWEGKLFAQGYTAGKCRAGSTPAARGLTCPDRVYHVAHKNHLLVMLGETTAWDNTCQASPIRSGTRWELYCLLGSALWKNGASKRLLKAIQLSNVASVQFWPWIPLCGWILSDFRNLPECSGILSFLWALSTFAFLTSFLHTSNTKTYILRLCWIIFIIFFLILNK